MRTLLALLVVPLFAQSNSVYLAGVELRLGMDEDATLAKFADPSRFRISRSSPANSCNVLLKVMDSWTQAGSVTFNDGTLSRILKDEYTSNQNDAANLARAAYSAIAAGEKAGLIKVWTARNDDANEPMYEIHLAFKDREVTIGAMTIQGHEIASVQTYFPQILKQAR